MKSKAYFYQIIFVVVTAVLMVSCKDPLKNALVFSSNITNGDVHPDANGVYHVSKGAQLNFTFEGNADFISATYNIFNESKTTLSFITALATWSDNKDNLHVYLSTDFPGLGLQNPKADSALVNSHNWVDITSLCKIPEKKNTKDTTAISLEAYKDKKVVIAFKYDGKDTKVIRPMFTLSKMNMVNEVIKTGEKIGEVKVQNMDFKPFYAQGVDASAYQTSTDGGRWDVAFDDPVDNTAIKIRQVMINKPAVESWLISAPIAIPRGKNENSETAYIKNVHTVTNTYSIAFTEPGEWTLRFYAANANYKHKESKEQVYKFIVE